MVNREKYNKKVISFLETILKQYPTLRFEQLISILDNDKTDHFYEEPDDTLKRWSKKGYGKFV
jgi:hypothetical protein